MPFLFIVASVDKLHCTLSYFDFIVMQMCMQMISGEYNWHIHFSSMYFWSEGLEKERTDVASGEEWN